MALDLDEAVAAGIRRDFPEFPDTQEEMETLIIRGLPVYETLKPNLDLEAIEATARYVYDAAFGGTYFSAEIERTEEPVRQAWDITKIPERELYLWARRVNNPTCTNEDRRVIQEEIDRRKS